MQKQLIEVTADRPSIELDLHGRRLSDDEASELISFLEDRSEVQYVNRESEPSFGGIVDRYRVYLSSRHIRSLFMTSTALRLAVDSYLNQVPPPANR